MSYVTSQSSESFRRVCIRLIKIAVVIVLAVVVGALSGCTRNIDLPGGMSDQAFHIKADGNENTVGGYMNSNNGAVAVVVYYEHCAVINNTPSKYTLRVSKLREGSPPEVLAETVKYEAQLKEGLYLIEAMTPLGQKTDICQVHVIFKGEDPESKDFSGF